MNTESTKGDQRVLGYISKAAPCQPLTALHPLIPSHVAGHPLGLLAPKEGSSLLIAPLLVYLGQIELPLLIFNKSTMLKIYFAAIVSPSLSVEESGFSPLLRT